MKKIQFNKGVPEIGLTNNLPSPATRKIPKWYKDIPKHTGSKVALDGYGNSNSTVKACPPFLDSMMNGYTISTEFDIYVYWRDGYPFFDCKSNLSLISYHHQNQIVPEQVPEEFSKFPVKFINYWQIVTPPGYSALFTHPINRSDLPFMTLSGVVDTDKYKEFIHFPFLIKKDFEGIIPAGTPMVQITPFKRESWRMSLGQVDEDELLQNQVKLSSKISGGYKTFWWQRKEYK